MAAVADETRGEELRAAALAYAARGWRIIPLHTPRPADGGTCSCGRADCPSIGKHPRTRSGLKDATAREAVLQVWWQKWPDANVGIATGARSGLVVLDVDARHDGMDALSTLLRRHGELPNTLTAATGGGGFHLVFQHPGEGIVIRNAAGLDGLPGLDLRGDGGYIVAPPSLHKSGERYGWHDVDTPVAPLVDWLKDLLWTPREGVEHRNGSAQLAGVVHDHSGTGGDDGHYWLDKALAKASVGTRNDTGMWLATQLRDARLTEDDAAAVMEQYAASVPGEGYSAREALSTLKSVYTRPAREPARASSAASSMYFSASSAGMSATSFRPYVLPVPAADVDTTNIDAVLESDVQVAPVQPAASSQSRSRFRLLTDTEVERMPPPEWLIGSILPASRLSVVYGEYGSGKSFLVLDWALCVATGHAWCGHPTKQGSAVYIAGEGLGGIGKRIRAWKAHHGITHSVPLYVVGTAPQLLRHEDVGVFIETLRTLSPAPTLVIIDTLARALVGGDENAQKDMGVAVAAADAIRNQFSSHVLVVHHKPNSAPGAIGGNGRTRGSSALPGAADVLVDVTLDGKLLTVSCAKQKDAARFQTLAFDLTVQALDDYAQETSCVLVRRDRGFSSSSDAGKQDLMLRVLREAESGGGLSYTEWKSACGRQGIASSTFEYHRKVLEGMGAVQNDRAVYTVASATTT